MHHFDISTLNALNQAPCGLLHVSECKWKQFHMWLKMQPLGKVFSASVVLTLAIATSLPPHLSLWCLCDQILASHVKFISVLQNKSVLTNYAVYIVSEFHLKVIFNFFKIPKIRCLNYLLSRQRQRKISKCPISRFQCSVWGGI